MAIRSDAAGKIAPIVAGIGAATILAVSLMPSGVRVCVNDGRCYDFSEAEYAETKAVLLNKTVNKTEFALDEYRLLVGIIDQEIKQRGGLNVTDVRDPSALLNKVALETLK